MKPKHSIIASLSVMMFFASTAQATIVLYDQNFENPAAFVNDGGDVNILNPVSADFMVRQPDGQKR